jgi:cytoskeletal protein CcmA (bactofilin family)
MFGKTGKGPGEGERDPASVQQFQRLAVAYSPTPASAEAPETVSSLSSGMTVVGKIVSDGTVKIFGRVEGELHASSVFIADGADVVGDLVAQELTVGGRVKGIVHANRVKLNSTAIVEGDIFHRSLAIEENARFEGSSKREDNPVDAPTHAQLKRPTQAQPQAVPAAAAAPAAVAEGRKVNRAPETLPPRGNPLAPPAGQVYPAE